MISIYQITGGVYWLVIYLSQNVLPEINSDFMVINENYNLLPLYYTTDRNKKLYILLETSRNKLFSLYINTNITDKVLVHDTRLISDHTVSTSHDIKRIYDQFNNKSPKRPTKELIDVLLALPSDKLLPYFIEVLFRQEYAPDNFMPNLESLTPLPVLTNG
nr:hypothetical protein [Abalone asfa-like virus]